MAETVTVPKWLVCTHVVQISIIRMKTAKDSHHLFEEGSVIQLSNNLWKHREAFRPMSTVRTPDNSTEEM